MNAFCSIPNHTYAMLNLNEERVSGIKGNEIIGFFGKPFDDLLIRKHLRKCKLIGEPNLGERLDNGTWTGNLGLIQKGEAILNLKIEALLIDTSIERWMHYLFPFHREKFVISQDISSDISEASKKENMTNVLNCFDFNWSFLISLIFTTFLSFSIIIALKLLSYRNKSRKRKKISIGQKIKNVLLKYLNGQWNLDYSKLTNITTFILFYSLYLWFIQLVIANNIKTNKVVVDQSILIKDENDALTTKKTFCLVEGETELSIALSSNSNIISKLYNQKNIASKFIKGMNINKDERCIFKKTIGLIDFDTNELFLVISENTLWLMSLIIGTARPELIIWFNYKPIFEMDFQMISKNQKDLIDLFNRIMLFNTEAGITTRLVNYFSLNSFSFLQSHAVYRTIEEFVDANTKFTDLNTDAFKLLFIIYISFCLTILIINLLHYLFVKTTLFYRIRTVLKFKNRSI